MTTQHTPGPWKVKQSQGATLRLFGGPHIQAGRRTIAWPDFPSVSENDTSEANARLIAAAPDLLAALKALFQHCAMVHNKWGDNDNQREADASIAYARLAITKAEGRA